MNEINHRKKIEPNKESNFSTYDKDARKKSYLILLNSARDELDKVIKYIESTDQSKLVSKTIIDGLGDAKKDINLVTSKLKKPSK